MTCRVFRRAQTYADDDALAVALLLMRFTLNQFVYPLLTWAVFLSELQPWEFGVGLARNMLLLLWAAILFRSVIARPVASSASTDRDWTVRDLSASARR